VFTTAPTGEQLPAYTNIFDVSIAVGSILYAFEGQAMVLPLENAMLQPQDMRGCTGVLTVGEC
jgi:proton-coupled amino acid transporter